MENCKKTLAITLLFIAIEITINHFGNNIIKVITNILLILTIVFSISLCIHFKRKEKESHNKGKIYNINNSTYKQNSNDQTFNESHLNQPHLYSKKPLLTRCEKEFLSRLRNIFDGEYFVQSQIGLRTIIQKNEFSYANELNRYIDFGLIDEDENIVALIELNDISHTLPDRKERDEKVNAICRQAQIPLITFWTRYYNTDEEIYHIVKSEIKRQSYGNTKDN